MKHPELEQLEAFAAGRISAEHGYTVLWRCDSRQTGMHAEKLLALIAEYESLPRCERNYTFVVTPTAMLVSRIRSNRVLTSA